MDTASLRRRIEQIIHTDSSVFAQEIINRFSSCTRCGWCCRENFKIRITESIYRPSNAISVHPNDIKCIIKNTGMEWHEVVEPDIYSCISDGNDVWAIGWILKRDNEQNCTFYSNKECKIYPWRPVICRCYPFFMDDGCRVDAMHGETGQGKSVGKSAAKIGMLLKRYELKKLQSYIRIIKQMENKLDLTKLHQLPEDYSGTVYVCDGDAISSCRIEQGTFTHKI